MGLQIAHTDAREECFGGSFTFFPLVGKGRSRRHWTIMEGMDFGKMHVVKGHIILDTGASVIAMPQTVFKTFVDQLTSLGIKFDYSPGRMLGSIDCSDVAKLPDWVLRKEGGNGIRITKQMFVQHSSDGRCLLLVSDLEDNMPLIIGTPLLGHVVSEFDSERQHVGLCHPRNSWIQHHPDILTTTLSPGRFDDIHDPPDPKSSDRPVPKSSDPLVSTSAAQGFYLATLLFIGFLFIH
jgi:hypothetical protein